MVVGKDLSTSEGFLFKYSQLADSFQIICDTLSRNTRLPESFSLPKRNIDERAKRTSICLRDLNTRNSIA